MGRRKCADARSSRKIATSLSSIARFLATEHTRQRGFELRPVGRLGQV
jgi:hypothetical protein